MAIKQIAIDTGILQNDITAYEEALNTVKSKMDNMFTNMKELDTMWEGEANNAFMVQFNKDYSSMKELCNLLTKLLEDLKLAKKEYDQCDSSVNTVINAIQIEGN